MRVRPALLPVAALLALLAAPATADAAFAHVVSRGESLYSIAAADGLTVAQLAAANGLSSQSHLIAGATVVIPPRASGPAPGAPAMTAGPGVIGGSVGDGESDDPGSPEGAAVSPSPGPSYRSPRVPPLGAGTSLARSTMPSSQPLGTQAEGSPLAPPYPTAERLSASQIARIAAAHGVPPSLAEAVAWQESGFNNDLVSTADARGVMQILPGTWGWIQRSLVAGAPPLAPASASDNVRGGVLMLGSLLRATGGDPGLAAAGYYQGLASVRSFGMFRSTRRYVSDVLALAHRFGGG